LKYLKNCLFHKKGGVVLLKEYFPPKQKIIAAIPAYNEAKYIGQVIRQTKKYVHQVIVVDDGSTDETAQVAKTAGATVVKHKINMGKGVSINTAFQIARQTKPFAMVLLDADGQHDPKEIPLLLEPLFQNGTDMVVGSRFMTNNHIPRYRLLGQSVLNLTTYLGSGIKLKDSQSGFRAFSQKAIECLSFDEEGFAVESEMQFQAKKWGLRVAEVPITTNYNGKIKRSPAVHGFGVLFRVIKLTGDKYLNSYLNLNNQVNNYKANIPRQYIPFPQENIQVTEAKNQ
jgi:glycosyltransferase involved in cell wall biosynthesis